MRVGFASEATVNAAPSTETVIWFDVMWRGYQTRFNTRFIRVVKKLSEVVSDENERNKRADRSNEVLHPERNTDFFGCRCRD